MVSANAVYPYPAGCDDDQVRFLPPAVMRSSSVNPDRLPEGSLMVLGCSDLCDGLLDDGLHIHIGLANAALTDRKQACLGLSRKVEHIA